MEGICRRPGPATGEKPRPRRARFSTQGQRRGTPARCSAGRTVGAQAACGEGGGDCEPKVVPCVWRCPFFPGGYCEPTPLGVSTALGPPWPMPENTWGPQAGLATGLGVVSAVSLRRGQQAGPLTNSHPQTFPLGPLLYSGWQCTEMLLSH